MRRKRASTRGMPVVPNDEAIRHEALETSTGELQQLDALQYRVDAVTSDLRGELRRNNFIERLKFAYGR